ncbi:4-alpha-glucanotransferase [Candidatus Vondammii sp. HM_W22]|uniref:4-alpha-glucanotransferase n=1 Tax=Candidatus Vondammii sp. HM_W22 TaxID=2687299 RepID=UPI001F147959|nr:4-alpha-glucanotransferase [Candidatus Vondammii sp. HM_W22]
MITDNTPKAIDQRSAGVLLHPTSLPSGDLGSDAYRFVDFLTECKFSYWQMLPLGQPSHGLSPYQCLSVHAGNTALISPEMLVKSGWIESIPTKNNFPDRTIALRQAWNSVDQNSAKDAQDKLSRFEQLHAHWIKDYALFLALKAEHNDAPWWEWPEPLRDRNPEAIRQAESGLEAEIRFHSFGQFIFLSQWQALRQYANVKGIRLFGDTPIFIAENSADAWTHRNYFLLNEQGRPSVVAGVPPDYFSSTGQRWGNPLYNWEAIQADGFSWWIEQLETQFDRFDLLRIDHFRSFQAYWEISAASQTAETGRGVEAPGEALFEALDTHFNPLPIVVEDLGTITEEVTALRDQFELPGMKILQFAFDGNPDNPYLPDNIGMEFVVYTGTHDNDTTVGWYDDLPDDAKERVGGYTNPAETRMPWGLIELALSSNAKLAILPMQDLLELGSEARMNLPGSLNQHNWAWQVGWHQIPEHLAERLSSLLQACNREYTNAQHPCR